MSNKRERAPDYQCWWEGDFRNDFTVMQMNWLQRLLYRCLLQQAFVCETQPYVPDDDNILWILAGAESLEQWQREKALIVSKFEPFQDDQGRKLLRHKRLAEDWQRVQQTRQAKAAGYDSKAPLRKEKASRAATARWQAENTGRCSADANACPTDATACSTMPKRQTKSKTKTKRENQTTDRSAGRLAPDPETVSTAQDPDPSQAPASCTPTTGASDAVRLANLMRDEFFGDPEKNVSKAVLRRMTKDAVTALSSQSFESLQDLMTFAKNTRWWHERITEAAYPMAFFAKSLDSLAEQCEAAKLAKPNTPKSSAKDRAKPDVSGAMSWLKQPQIAEGDPNPKQRRT